MNLTYRPAQAEPLAGKADLPPIRLSYRAKNFACPAIQVLAFNIAWVRLWNKSGVNKMELAASRGGSARLIFDAFSRHMGS